MVRHIKLQGKRVYQDELGEIVCVSFMKILYTMYEILKYKHII